MNGWIETTLEGATDIITRGISPKYVEKGGACVLNQRCIRGHKIDYETARRHCVKTKPVKEDRYIRVGDVLINSTGVGTLGRVAQVREDPGEPTVVDSHVTILRPKSGLFHPDFLGFLLISLEEILMGMGEGASGQTELSRTKIKGLKISFPKSHSEQKRVVEILDEAFDGIAKATANAQRNLSNARLLHQRYIEMSLRKLWATEPVHFLSDVCIVERGSSPRPIKSFLTTKSNGVNWVKIGDVSDEDKFVIQTKEKITPEGAKQSRRVYPGDFILTNSMSYGRPYIMKIEGCVHDGWFVLRLKENISPDYFYYVLSSPQVKEQFGKLASGSVVLNIRSELVKQASFPVPPYNEQVKLAKLFDSSLDQQRRLYHIYQKKVDELDQLKQSLLHKAFTGQLTSSAVVASVKKLESPSEANAKLTAQIIILAHYRHAAAQRDKTFGHVKEQKILHLAESCANIPLGRSPIKDAAGPNDFAHMLRAEEWAESNGFFKVNERDSGYSFQKLKGYNQFLSEAQERLKPFKQRLDKIMDVLVPMNTQEAEVFATVHAAWNNLIVDRKAVTDDAIIKEARDTWHPDKLKIPKEKFLKAIQLIRKEGLIPDGSAKPVRFLQEKLL